MTEQPEFQLVFEECSEGVTVEDVASIRCGSAEQAREWFKGTYPDAYLVGIKRINGGLNEAV